MEYASDCRARDRSRVLTAGMHAERQLFRQRRIFVDFGSFHHCTFEGCTLVYSAAGPYHFDHCDFLDVR
jgi:hypothetical protein